MGKRQERYPLRAWVHYSAPHGIPQVLLDLGLSIMDPPTSHPATASKGCTESLGRGTGSGEQNVD